VEREKKEVRLILGNKFNHLSPGATHTNKIMIVIMIQFSTYFLCKDFTAQRPNTKSA
jgi:hypothetical protein